MVYIGETGRNIDTRIREHKYAVNRGDENNALYRHVWNKDHRVDWKNSHLLYKCNDFIKRRVIESMCIEKYDNFNLSEGAFKLDPIMRSLVVKSLPAPIPPP